MSLQRQRGAVGVAGVAVMMGAAFAISACGSSDSTSTAASAGATTTKSVAKAPTSWPATTVDLGGGERVTYPEGKKPRFVFFNFGSGFTYTAAIVKGAQERAKQLGVGLDVLDAQVNPQKQVQQMQDAISSGKYAGGFVLPIAESLMCDLGTKAAPKNNFMLVVTNAPLCGREQKEGSQLWAPGSLAFDSAGQEISAFKAWAEYIQQKNPGPQKVIALLGPQTAGQSQNAAAALKQVAAQNPGFKIEQFVYTDFTAQDALQKMQDALQAHPDATIVASIYSELTKSTTTVLAQQGKSNVKVYDVGADSSVLPLIKSGKVDMTYPYYPSTMGATAIQALVDARLGKEFKRVYENSGHDTPEMQGGDRLLFVTKDNVDAFSKAGLSEY